ncbi:MAG: hypothetical protein R6U25_10145 [Alkalispirochaeta sp.]
MARTLIAACGGPAVAQVRKTFPVTPDADSRALLHRRGLLLSHGSLTLAELPPLREARPAAGDSPASFPTGAPLATPAAGDTPASFPTGAPLASPAAGDTRGENRSDSSAEEVTAELAFYLGHCRECTAVLVVIPAPRLILADRIIAPGRRELIPDLLEPASRIDASVTVTAVDDAVVWAAAQWALRRVGPHQFWVVGLPVKMRTPGGGERPGRPADGDAADGYAADGHRSGAHAARPHPAVPQAADVHAARPQASAPRTADPQATGPASDSATHRGLRSVVAALEEQTR